MAKLIKRTWTSRGPTGHRVRKVAHGYTLQVPCRPCPHRDTKTGEILHPNGVRQVRVVNSAWSREDAEKALAAYLLGVEQEQAKASALMTFGEAIEQYLKAKARKRSLAFDKLYLNQFKAEFGARTPLMDITAARISTWKADKLSAVCPRTGKPYAAASINRPLAALRHLLQLAHEEWGVLSAVPKMRLEKEPQGRIRWLEPDEEVRLLAACAQSRNPELTKIVTIALETGLRKGELLGLTWDRVDLSRGGWSKRSRARGVRFPCARWCTTPWRACLARVKVRYSRPAASGPHSRTPWSRPNWKASASTTLGTILPRGS